MARISSRVQVSHLGAVTEAPTFAPLAAGCHYPRSLGYLEVDPSEKRADRPGTSGGIGVLASTAPTRWEYMGGETPTISDLAARQLALMARRLDDLRRARTVDVIGFTFKLRRF